MIARNQRFLKIPIYLLILQSIGVSQYVSRAISGYFPDFPAITSSDIRIGMILVAAFFAVFFSGRIKVVPVFIVFYSLFTVLSALWSVSPEETLERSLLLTGVTALYICISNSLTLERMFIYIRNTLTACLVLGLLLYLAGDSHSYTEDALSANIAGLPGLSGVFDHNVFSGVLAVFNVVILTRYPFGRPAISILALAISAAFVILSDSVTAYVMAVAAGPVFLVWKLAFDRNANRLLAAALVVIVPVAALIAALNMALIAAALDRSADLSGRGPIWISGLHLWLERPILGWGYSSIFGEGGAISVMGITVGKAHWIPPHFHNDFLQVLVESGVLGLALFMGAIVSGFSMRRHKAREQHLFNVLLSLLILFSFTGEIFAAQKFGWALLIWGVTARRQDLPKPDGQSASALITPSAKKSAIRSME